LGGKNRKKTAKNSVLLKTGPVQANCREFCPETRRYMRSLRLERW
jgi:hypothetical protein